jgi:uncharacterized protein (DUF1810 family)
MPQMRVPPGRLDVPSNIRRTSMKKFHDPFDLERFVSAQAHTHARVIAELTAGKKQSHWMWYTFPQMRGLGTSDMSQKFGIDSYEEARAYVCHPVLGPRLVKVTALMLDHRYEPLLQILGTPDNLKFHSSMTLFAAVTGQESIFAKALFTFCNGADPKTMTLLARCRESQ